MKNDDVELIQQVLAGDENAFAELVKKYQIIYYNKNPLVNTFQKADLLTFLEKITQKSLFYRKNAYFCKKCNLFVYKCVFNYRRFKRKKN